MRAIRPNIEIGFADGLKLGATSSVLNKERASLVNLFKKFGAEVFDNPEGNVSIDGHMPPAGYQNAECR